MDDDDVKKTVYNNTSVANETIPHSVIDFKLSKFPYRQGFLFKRGKGLFKRWVRRFFVLDSFELNYFYQPTKEILGGSLNVNIMNVSISFDSDKIKIFNLSKKNVMSLKADNLNETLMWFEDIYIHIKTSFGPYAIINESRLFSKFYRITDKDLLNTAKTGDLLLFKGKYFLSKVQRIVTRSECDHVAIIIKYAKEKIAVLESTYRSGVNVVLWEEFLNEHPERNSNQILYKKLCVERNEECLEKLERFVEAVQGNKFRLSLCELMARNREKKLGDKGGYFCSELVAMAYKVIGILPKDVPESRYWPGDFSDKKNIKLVGEAYFRPSKQVEFIEN